MKQKSRRCAICLELMGGSSSSSSSSSSTSISCNKCCQPTNGMCMMSPIFLHHQLAYLEWNSDTHFQDVQISSDITFVFEGIPSFQDCRSVLAVSTLKLGIKDWFSGSVLSLFEQLFEICGRPKEFSKKIANRRRYYFELLWRGALLQSLSKSLLKGRRIVIRVGVWIEGEHHESFRNL